MWIIHRTFFLSLHDAFGFQMRVESPKKVRAFKKEWEGIPTPTAKSRQRERKIEEREGREGKEGGEGRERKAVGGRRVAKDKLGGKQCGER
jgi:hypothetical protein